MVNRIAKGASGSRGGQFAPDYSGKDKVPTAGVKPSLGYSSTLVADNDSANVENLYGKFSASKARVAELEASIKEREERIGQWKIFVRSAELKGRNLRTVEQVVQNIKFEEEILANDRSKLLKLSR